MARKSKAKREEELINSLFGLVVFASFFGTFQLTKSFSISVVVSIVALCLLITILIFRKLERVEKLKKSGIKDIDSMDGRQFEHYLGHLFRSQGYQVSVTRAAGDYGADLVLSKSGQKIVVQAKRHSKNVGIEAVQQVHSSKSYYGAAGAWVISNRDYTEAAYQLAKSNDVRLINRDELIEMILKMNPGAVPKPAQILQEMPSDNRVCEKCGNPMILRKGTRGEFYGCSSFPKCRNMKPI